jgi:hypothetical protein
MSRVMLSLVVSMALMLGGCGKKMAEKAMEKAIEKGGGGKAHVDLSKNQVRIQTKDGDKMEFAGGGEGLKIPADFPKDIHVYQGAKVEGSIKTGEATQLTFTTADAAAKVAEEYQGKMKQAGWEEKTSAQMSGMTMLEYKKDQRNLMVHITSDGKTTRIMLILSKENEPGK